MKTVLTNAEIEQRLLTMKRRATLLCGRAIDGTALSSAVCGRIDAMIADMKDPVKLAERKKFLEAAATDPNKQQQLCAIRVRTVNNFILSSMNITPMFAEIVELGNADRFAIQKETKTQIRVGFIRATDGAPTRQLIEKEQDEFLVPLRWLSTEKIEYPFVDIYSGEIATTMQATFDQNYDYANQKDAEVFKLLTAPLGDGGAFGTFTFDDAKKVNWVYVANRRINTANLPTTNDINTGNTSSTKFRFQTLKQALDYEARWAGAFRDGDLRFTGRVLIPGADITNIADEITPSGSTSNSVADKLMEQGWAEIDYLGRRFTLIADNTLAPGACYFEMNKKPVQILLKPGLGREEVDDSYDLKSKNLQGRFYTAPFGAVITASDRPKALRVRYNSGFDPEAP